MLNLNQKIGTAIGDNNVQQLKIAFDECLSRYRFIVIGERKELYALAKNDASAFMANKDRYHQLCEIHNNFELTLIFGKIESVFRLVIDTITSRELIDDSAEFLENNPGYVDLLRMFESQNFITVKSLAEAANMTLEQIKPILCELTSYLLVKFYTSLKGVPCSSCSFEVLNEHTFVSLTPQTEKILRLVKEK